MRIEVQLFGTRWNFTKEHCPGNIDFNNANSYCLALSLTQNMPSTANLYDNLDPLFTNNNSLF
jgi:hypothetical protein